MTVIRVPGLSLVVLVGASGSGKSTFAATHFAPTEVLSSDRFRAMVSDDETDQSATAAAFEALHLVAKKRLERGKLTVVDATNVQREARAPLLRLARESHVFAVAIVLDLPAGVCAARNALRPERAFGAHVVRHQRAQLRASLRTIRKEGFRDVTVLGSQEEIDAATIERTRLWNDRRDDRGPFDVVGDVHGCASELRALLAKLGYEEHGGAHRHPEGRKVVFLGDLVDRGPRIAETLRIAMAMVRAGSALCVPGNHEAKLERKLDGRSVKLTHGLAQTVEQLEREPEAFVAEVRDFLGSLVSHYVLDGGRLVVAHAGLPEHMQAAPRAACASTASTATRAARRTTSACRCGATGRSSTGARPR
ncbi:MAG: AAA family ATPase [Sandaracinaceae bacterium]|nr:AAA family ATPase [Sandaracinaceae bacterium]